MTTRTKKLPENRYRTESLGTYSWGGPASFLRQFRITTGANTSISGPFSGSKPCQGYMYDVVTPGFAQRVAAGEIVNSPMSKVSSVYNGSGDEGWLLHKTAANLAWECTKDSRIHFPEPTVSGVSHVDVNNLIIRAQTAALGKIQGANLQTLVALGEGVKTLRMIVSPMRALLSLLEKSKQSYIRDLKQYGNPLNRVMKIRGHKQRRAAIAQWKARNGKLKSKSYSVRDLEFIPDMVLSYNLGWKPLLNDIDQLIHKIPAIELQERRTARAQASDETSWETLHAIDLGSGCMLNYKANHAEQVTVRAGVMYKDDFSPSTHFGTRLKDVPQALWELIPFSFLSDYVLNLGDFIEAMTNPIGVSKLAFFTTVSSIVTTNRTFTSATATSGWSVVRHPSASDESIYTAKSRDVGGFQPRIAHKLTWNLAGRPPAQLQNVLSLFTKFLYGTRNSPFY